MNFRLTRIAVGIALLAAVTAGVNVPIGRLPAARKKYIQSPNDTH